ncbi:MAG TPA: sialidase family protein [Candidatus Dormibacteraeota bacterium]|nr:sialidase family protein [Candidatus Dormibacteraeota bacterium]
MNRRMGTAATIAAGLAIAISATAAASSSGLVRISSDPFTDPTAIDGAPVYHKTQVEPDTFAFGSTIVSAFQSGRFENGGASDIGWATSTNGGSSWHHGFLPGMTQQSTPPNTDPNIERVSDASVAYDARHQVWLISSIPLEPNTFVPTVYVNRSTDGGLTWSTPIHAVPDNTGDFDKNWTVCDNSPTSLFYGNCYTEYDNFAEGDLEQMITSSDGGLTWSTPQATADKEHGLGGQPLVQPNGTVIVPFEAINGNDISAFRSTNGGASWSATTIISKIVFHGVAGNLRTSPLPTAEIDGAGRVYVAWEDCRFEQACKANDIVVSTSDDGVNWSPVFGVPADPQGSGVDHFIPGIAVDKSTSGASAHIGLAYYFYPNANCSVSTCQLDTGFVSSTNGGATWSSGQQLAGPVTLTWLPLTSQGYMVGDYISTSFTGGAPVPAVAEATAGTSPEGLNEAMFAALGLTAAGGDTPAFTNTATSRGSSTSNGNPPTNR